MVKHGGGSITLWCCFPSAWTEALDQAKAIMDISKYAEEMITPQSTNPENLWKVLKAVHRRSIHKMKDIEFYIYIYIFLPVVCRLLDVFCNTDHLWPSMTFIMCLDVNLSTLFPTWKGPPL